MERLIRGLKGAQSQQGLASAVPSLADRNGPSRNVKVWHYLSDDKNRAVLGWIGGGIVVVISALWAAFVYFAPPPKPATPPSSIEASHGGVAVGGNVTGSTITVDGATSAGTPKTK
jgi:hypothetical protein